MFLFSGHHDLHDFQARQNSVSGCRILGKDDVSGLLSADSVAVLLHRLVDILVSDLRADIADTVPLE